MPKLQKFNKKENSKISSRKFIFAGIIILIILSIFVFYKSYAIYKVQKQYDVIKSQIGEFDTEDMILTSVRSQTLKSMFEAAYNYQRGNDSHMMKNTEWGAVAYLSHSKYGINTEVRINNNSSYLTGYAAVDGTDQSSYPGTYGTDNSITLPYNTTTGYKASTTGNITGVYDMSGGAHEYVAAYRKDTYGSSGFDATSLANYNSKYYDEYDASSDWTTHSKRILGDTTGEMGPFYYYADKDGSNRQHNNWYADISGFVNSSYPWLNRGVHYAYGVLAGQFDFVSSAGGAHINVGFRLVLAG